MQKILITGACGFIGRHLCRKLVQYNLFIIALDIRVDKSFLQEFSKCHDFYFLNECVTKTKVIERYKPDYVIHLASLAGVRNSLNNPSDYVQTNINGMINLLEQCKNIKLERFIYASSSSVYGNQLTPFKEDSCVSNQQSQYACTKRSCELMAQCYENLYNIQTVGLRFFTVYGPGGRIDMAPYKFMYNIMNGIPITLYGDGSSSRDYTYISDIITGIVKMIVVKKLNYNIYNLGSGQSIKLKDFVQLCEKITNKKAKILNMSLQNGDVMHTLSNCDRAKQDIKYIPKIKLKEGLTNLYNDLLS